MIVLQKFIQLVKNQINYFDQILDKNPTVSTVQTKFLILKHEFEQLLEYLYKQSETIYSNMYSPTLRPKTRKLEGNIFNIIKDHPAGIHTLDIKNQLKQRFEVKINDSILANRIHNMYKNRNIITRIKKGVYIITLKKEETSRYL